MRLGEAPRGGALGDLKNRFGIARMISLSAGESE